MFTLFVLEFLIAFCDFGFVVELRVFFRFFSRLMLIGLCMFFWLVVMCFTSFVFWLSESCLLFVFRFFGYVKFLCLFLPFNVFFVIVVCFVCSCFCIVRLFFVFLTCGFGLSCLFVNGLCIFFGVLFIACFTLISFFCFDSFSCSSSVFFDSVLFIVPHDVFFLLLLFYLVDFLFLMCLNGSFVVFSFVGPAFVCPFVGLIQRDVISLGVF